MANRVEAKVKSIRGGPLSKLTGVVPITPAILQDIGKALVKTLAAESKIYFTKRGWNGRDPMGGPPIWRSFKARTRGQSTLEITSTFYGMDVLASGDVPDRRMTWITQEAKDQHPENYPLTDGERKRGMKQSGRVSKGQRLPLVIPIQTKGGSVELRTAPLTLGEAWIHPGIAKFTFFETSIRKWRQQCTDILAKAAAKHITKG